MSGILEELTVSSWNIKGEDNSMQIWIRFKTDDTQIDRESVTYRKMSPSQVKRNKDRAANRTTTQHDLLCEEVKESETIESVDDADHKECAFKQQYDTEINVAVETDQQKCINDLGNLAVQESSERFEAATCQDTASHRDPSTSTNPSQHNRYHTRSQSNRNRPRPFKYKSVSVPLKCRYCERDYTIHTPSQSYFCNRCPCFICVRCVENHMHHKSTLKGPAPLSQIYDRYNSRY